MELNDLVIKAHSIAKSKGFYDKPVEIGTRIALIHSEVSEALEADRKGRWVKDKPIDVRDVLAIADDEAFNHEFRNAIKDTFEDEAADAVIRILDLCGAYSIDLEGHILAKMRYNSLRPYKHGKSY